MCFFSYLYKPKQCHQTDLASNNGDIMGAVEITLMCITVYMCTVMEQYVWRKRQRVYNNNYNDDNNNNNNVYIYIYTYIINGIIYN